MVPPALDVLNAATISKPHATDHLAADLRGYHVDVGIITETHFKKSHASNAFEVDGYSLYKAAGRRRCYLRQQSPAFISLVARQ